MPSGGGGFIGGGIPMGQFLGFADIAFLIAVGVVFYRRGKRRRLRSNQLSGNDSAWFLGVIVATGVAVTLMWIHFSSGFVALFLAVLCNHLGRELSGEVQASRSIEDVGTSGRRKCQADPQLEQRVREAWPKLQNAWELQDLDSVRSFLSDGMQARTQAQLECLARRGIRNRLENAKVISVETREAVIGAMFTSKTVTIFATGKDVEIDIKTGARKRGASSDNFREYWTFLKRTGVAAPERGLLEGVCPNCGAPIEVSASVVCPSCKSKIKSGQFDWVLTEISQDGAWRPRDRMTENVEAELLKSDHGFNVYAMEDHASMMFWKLARALGTDKVIKPSLPLHRDLKQRLETTWTDSRFHTGFHFEPVVGSVEIRSHEVVEGMDRLRVRASWILGPMTQLQTSRKANAPHGLTSGLFDTYEVESKTDPLAEPRCSEYVFERPVGTQTPVEQNLSTGHCQDCGGPESIEAVENCPWCGSPKPWGEAAWILRAIDSRSNPVGI